MTGKVAKTAVQVQTLHPGEDVQHALDQMPDNSALFFSPGTYTVDKPMRLRQSHARVEGIGPTYAQQIRMGRSFYGPICFGAPASRTPPHGPPLLSGTGHSLHLLENLDGWFQLDYVVDVDGLHALTIEFAFQPQIMGYPVDARSILNSACYLASCLPVSSAFGFNHYSTGVRVSLTTTAGKVSLSTAPLEIAETYHLALVYDGSHAHLYVDGDCVQSQPLTGAVLQHPLEEVILGPQSFAIPETALNVYSTACLL